MLALPLDGLSSRADADAALAAAIPEAPIRQWALQNLIATPKEPLRWRLNLPLIQRSMAHLGSFGAALPADAAYRGDTLFIRGLQSPYVDPDRDGPTILKYFPAATITAIDAGHWRERAPSARGLAPPQRLMRTAVHAEKPKEFVDEVVAFLM